MESHEMIFQPGKEFEVAVFDGKVSETTINATCSDGGFVERDDVNGKTAQVEWDAEESGMVVTCATKDVTALRVFLLRARVDVSHCVSSSSGSHQTLSSTNVQLNDKLCYLSRLALPSKSGSSRFSLLLHCEPKQIVDVLMSCSLSGFESRAIPLTTMVHFRPTIQKQPYKLFNPV
jgi:hypothetical protein